MNFQRLLWISSRKWCLQHHCVEQRNDRPLKRTVIATPEYGLTEQRERRGNNYFDST